MKGFGSARRCRHCHVVLNTLGDCWQCDKPRVWPWDAIEQGCRRLSQRDWNRQQHRRRLRSEPIVCWLDGAP